MALIPIIGFDREVMEQLKTGQRVDLSSGGVNLQLIYLDARGSGGKKKKDIMVHAVLKGKGGRPKKKDKENSNGVEAGNGVPRLKKGQKRRKYTLEFKQKCVAEMKAGEKPPEMSKRLGISEAMLYGWRAGRGMDK